MSSKQGLRVFFVIWESDGVNSDDFGHQTFKLKIVMVPIFKILSTTASSSRTIGELDRDTGV